MSVDDILVKVRLDTSEVDNNSSSIDKLGAKEKQVLKDVSDQTRKVTEDQKNLSTQTDKTVKNVNDLANAAAKFEKAAAGKIGVQAFKELDSAIGGASNQMQALNILATKGRELLNNSADKGSESYKKLEQEVSAAEITLKSFGQDQEAVRTKILNNTQAILEMRTAMAQMREEGKEGSIVYEQMRQQTEDLTDETSKLRHEYDETKKKINELSEPNTGFRALAEGARLFTAGMEAAQGAQVLFGEKNKDFEETLIKLQGLMALSMSLQEGSNILLGQSTLKTYLQTIAQKAYAVVIGESTGALLAFRIVLASITGLGFLAAIVAIASNWERIKEAITGTTEAQREYAEDVKEANKTIEKELGGLQTLLLVQKDENVTRAQKLQLFHDQQKLYPQTLKDYTDEEFLSGKVNEQIVKNIELIKQRALLKVYESKLTQAQMELEEKQEKQNTGAMFTFLSTIGLGLVAWSDQQKGIKKATEAVDEYAKKYLDLLEKINAAGNLAEETPVNKDAAKDAISERIALLKKELLQRQGNLTEEIRITNEIIRLEAQLNAVGKTRGEKALLYATAELAVKKNTIDISKRYSDEAYKNELDNLDARLKLVQKNSAAELELKKTQIDEQKNLDISDIEFSALSQTEKQRRINAIIEIANQEKLQLEQNFQRAQDKLILDHAEAEAQMRLTKTVAGSADELRAKNDLLIAKERLAEQEANNELETGVLTYEQYTDKVRLLNAQLYKDLNVNNKAFFAKQLDEETAAFTQQNELKKDKLQLAAAKDLFSNKAKLDSDLRDLELQNLDILENAVNAKHAAGLTSEAEYQAALAKLNGDRIKLQIAQEEEKKQAIQNITDQAFSLAQSVISFGVDREKEATDAKIAQLERQKSAELANKTLTEEQKARIDARYRKQEAVLKRDAAIKEKHAQEIQATLNMFQAIAKANSAAPPPFNYILMALAAASGAIQIAGIERTPIPEFAVGTKEAPSGFKWVGEKGPELIYDQGGYPIITHEESMSLAHLLDKYGIGHDIMNGHELRGDLISHPDIPQASQTMIDKQRMEMITNNYNSNPIDYDRFGNIISEKVGEEIAKHPRAIVNMDKDGFHTFLEQGDTRTEIVNNKFSG